MMRMKAAWAPAAVLFLWACGGPAKAASSCQDWNTTGFFEHAEAADVSRCLDAGATVDARDEAELTPLHLAAGFSKTAAITEVLLDAGAKVDARNKDGETPLHRAAQSGAHAAVKILLDAGAEVNVKSDRDEETPLLRAAAKSDTPAVVEALLDAGADPAAKNISDSIPWQYAQNNSALEETNAYRRLRELSEGQSQ